MKQVLIKRLVGITLSLVAICTVAIAQSNNNNAPMTNAAVVKLVKAGFKEKSILAIISSRPAQFDLSTDRMIELKRDGVPEKVILAMLARQQGNDFDDEAFMDDGFFNSPMNGSSAPANGQQQSAKSTNPNDGSSVDIFGSNGNSRGATRSRGSNQDASGDTITTGSATVKILRPPSEAGSGPAKLEKTPSLNNDAVIELVEAGFSDGTIIRRIEQSPVNFDFTPEKLADLKKHRVSDKILLAMKAAMGVDSNNTPTSNGSPKQ